jgi:hypothetical protein
LSNVGGGNDLLCGNNYCDDNAGEDGISCAVDCVTECNDLVDNDRDGYLDLDDSGCVDGNDDMESTSSGGGGGSGSGPGGGSGSSSSGGGSSCGDGTCDLAEDGISCSADCVTQCNDLYDNDNDGAIDLDDPDCDDLNDSSEGNLDSSVDDDGLLAHYQFENNVFDSSGNSYDGVNDGGASFSSDSMEGGYSLSLDGVSNYVTLPSEINVSGSLMTIAFWFKANNVQNYGRFISKTDGLGVKDNNHWVMVSLDNGQFRGRLKTLGSTSKLIGGSLLNGVWTHGTFVYDGSEMRLYVDGSEVAMKVKGGAIDVDNSLEVWVGANPGGTDYYDGKIDDLRIYNRVLNDSEIVNLAGGSGSGGPTCGDGVCDSNSGEDPLTCPADCGVFQNSEDICTNYFTGNVNKPAGWATYSSLLQDSWTWRRNVSLIDPSTIIDVGGDTPDYISLKAAFSSAKSGDTILVHGLQGSELTFLDIGDRTFDDGNPVHIYFMAIMEVGEGTWNGADIMRIYGIENVVFDGMNNLKLVAGPVEPGVPLSPRDLIFVGGSYGAVRNVVVKNMELDGRFYNVDESYWNSNGAKWGVKGNEVTNFVACNLYVHNIREQHGFYFNVADENLEFVLNKVDTVQWTCFQVRTDEITPETLKIVVADNYCINSCDGSAITIDDPGHSWIYGNTVIDSAGGFTSLDSDDPGKQTTPEEQDQRFAKVYVYNNKFLFDNDPIQMKWNPASPCGGQRKRAGMKRGGASFYFKNNIFLNIRDGSFQKIFSRESDSKYYTYYPGSTFHMTQLRESDNNIFGLGGGGASENSFFAKWGYQDLTKAEDISAKNWVLNLPQYGKPAFDVNSQFAYGPSDVQDLIDIYFG